jgi:hypothetical protein
MSSFPPQSAFGQQGSAPGPGQAPYKCGFCESRYPPMTMEVMTTSGNWVGLVCNNCKAILSAVPQ